MPELKKQPQQLILPRKGGYIAAVMAENNEKVILKWKKDRFVL